MVNIYEMDLMEKLFYKGESMIKDIKKDLENNGYDYAVAIATEAEINAGAACGQLSIIIENDE